MHELTQSKLTVGKCNKPLWWGTGMPAGLCGELAFGEQKYLRDYCVTSWCCPHHGGPTLKESIAGKIVLRFDGPLGHEGPRFIEAERDGKSISVGEWVQDGDDWLLVLHDDGRSEAADA